MEGSLPSLPEEEGASQEERIAWLRKRGVQIEIPGEAAPVDDGSGEHISITIVKVPANDASPLEELSVPVAVASGDQMLIKLRKFFASSTHEIDAEKLKDSATKQFGSQDVRISPDSLQKVSELGCVECFTLDSPSDANKLQGTNIYLDEAGQLKGLESNKRATGLAKLCGFDNVPFVGDVFIGRTVMTRNGIANAHFTLQDMDSSAAWLNNGVAARNYEIGASRGQIDMVGGGEEPHHGGKDETRGITWSETGENVEIQFAFPGGATYTPKQLAVKIASKAVSVALKAQPEVALLNLSLKGSVRPDDSTWTISGGVLELTLEKTSEAQWGRLEA